MNQIRVLGWLFILAGILTCLGGHMGAGILAIACGAYVLWVEYEEGR